MGRCPRFQGTWVVIRDPRFMVSGSRDFWDVVLAPSGTIIWIGHHDIVIDPLPNEDSYVWKTC